MKNGDMLFVYGTLRRGERADLTKNSLIHAAQFMSADEINGLLYHLGAYPGVKLCGSPEDFNAKIPSVIGEVFLIQDSSVPAILDAYEGYPNLYNRSQVMSKKGRLVWVYTFNGGTTDDQLIETGDWKNPRLSVTHRVPKFN